MVDGKRAAVKDRMINFRVDAAFDTRMQEEAEIRFDGSKGHLSREAVELYLTLRNRLGVQFDPTIALLTSNRNRIEAPEAVAS